MSRWWPDSSLEFNNWYLQLVGVTTPARGYKVVNSRGFENNKLRQREGDNPINSAGVEILSLSESPAKKLSQDWRLENLFSLI